MKTLSPKRETLAGAVRDALGQLQNWVTIDEAIKHCSESGAFKNMTADDLIREAKANIVRKALRQAGRIFPGEDGHGVEWVNLKSLNRRKETENRYKQLSLFTQNDFIQVIKDRQRRAKYFRGESNRFVELAVEKFGDAFKERLVTTA